MDEWMDGERKGQGGVAGLDSPVVSPGGAACVAAGRLSPLPANRGPHWRREASTCHSKPRF